MAVNNGALDIIVKECCRSLSFDDGERQFAFPLRTGLPAIWERIRGRIREVDHDLHLDDFNGILARIEHPWRPERRIPVTTIADDEMVNGEVVSFSFHDGATQVMVRMGKGQWLDTTDGGSFSFPEDIVFARGAGLVTSEGESLGTLSAVELLPPSQVSLALGRVFIGRYYQNPIGRSLWPIFNLAAEAYPRCDAEFCAEILKLSRKLGVGAFSLMNILKAVCIQ